MSDPRVPEPLGGMINASNERHRAELAQVKIDTVADTRARLAYLIRAELVCCDIYDRVAGPLDEVRLVDRTIEHAAVTAWGKRRRAARIDGTWHDICYFGEWSARLCEMGELPEGDLEYITTRWKEPANQPEMVPRPTTLIADPPSTAWDPLEVQVVDLSQVPDAHG